MLIPVIGLEIHCELQTVSKVFCTCENQFGGEANTRVCPTCAGLPGTLPVLNRTAVEYAAAAGVALGCTVNEYAEFDRKNYVYPDLPKAYQISQLFFPLCTEGSVAVPDGRGGEKTVRINRVHLEEDAGKLMHEDLTGLSLADYNRCGVPLIEIVTEPDIASAEAAAAFVRQVVLTLRYAGVSDCRMEQGSLRVDVNISLKEADADALGTRAEIKNLNSIKSVMRAIEYEIKRQREILAGGGRIIQETRSFNDNTGRTRALRSKGDAHGYRYFADPDIPPVSIAKADIERIRASLPVMPEERTKKYTGSYGLSAADAANLVQSRPVSDFYDETLRYYHAPRPAANLILGELFRLVKERNEDEVAIPFPAEHFAYLIQQQETGAITKGDAKNVLSEMYRQKRHPKDIIAAMGIGITDDDEAVEAVISEVLISCAAAVDQYKQGETKVFGFLMGQCNQKLQGKASPALIKKHLEEALSRV